MLSEDLELNISGALSAVDDLSSALNAAVQQFSGDLQTALGTAVIAPEVDTAGIDDGITAAVQAADTTVLVDPDVSLVGGSIDEALAAANAVLSVDGDTTALSAAIAAEEGQTVTVTVEADTAQASADIGALGQSAQDATGQVSGLTAATSSFGSVAGLANGSTAALGKQVSGLIPGGAAAAVGLGAVAAAGDSYFNSAVKATAATERFQQTFGSLASEVNNINVGNLDQSLGDLSLSLGSSASEVRNVVSSFGQLGQADGQAADQVAKTSEQLVALSARAVALNPSLGSVGEVAGRLQTALARGGRFAAQYGLSLSSAEINAKALAMTGKQTADQLTQYEKAAAGAALATEKYGSTLQETIARGAGNPIVQLKAIGAEFSKFTTELGKPLIAPGFDLIRSVQPVLKSAAGLLGELAQALLPVAQGIVDAFGPALTGVFDTLGSTVAALEPALSAITDAFVALVQPVLAGLLPAFDGLVQAVIPLGQALEKVVVQNKPLIDLFGQTLGVLAEGAGLTIGAILDVVGRLISLLSDLGAFTNPLLDVAKAFGLIDDQATGATQAVGSTAKATATNVADLRKELEKTDAAFADTIVSQSAFSKDSSVVDALRRTRIPFATLQKDLGDLDKGFKDFTAAAIDAGQVKITTPEGVALTAQQVRDLNGNLTEYLNTSGAVIVQGAGLVNAFNAQQTSTEATAQSTFAAIVAQQGLTDEQTRAIGATAAATFGVDSYQNRLAVLAQTTNEASAAQANAGTQTFGQAAAYTALTQAVAAGNVTTANAAQVAQALGLDVQTTATAIGNAEQAVNNFVSNALSKFPTVTTVFEDLKRSANPNDPQSLINSLNAATLGALTFQSTLDTLRERFPETVQFLQQQGPQAAGAFAAAFASASPEVQAQLEAAIKANKSTLGTIEADLRGAIAGNTDAARALGGEVTKGLGESLEFDKVTTDEVNKAADAIKQSTPVPEQAARDQGATVGDALAAGLAIGIGRSNPIIEQAARDAVRRAAEAARDEGQIRSPSRLFAEIGQQLIAGLDQGITQAGTGTLSTMENLFNQFTALAGDAGNGLVLTWDQAVKQFGADRIIKTLDDPRIRGRQTVGDIIGTEAVVAGTPAALRAVRGRAERLRNEALRGLSQLPPQPALPPVAQVWLGAAPNGAPLSKTQAAIAFWGAEVGMQINRSLQYGRLGTFLTEFTKKGAGPVSLPVDVVLGSEAASKRDAQNQARKTVSVGTLAVNVTAGPGVTTEQAQAQGQAIGQAITAEVLALEAQIG